MYVFWDLLARVWLWYRACSEELLRAREASERRQQRKAREKAEEAERQRQEAEGCTWGFAEDARDEDGDDSDGSQGSDGNGGSSRRPTISAGADDDGAGVSKQCTILSFNDIAVSSIVLTVMDLSLHGARQGSCVCVLPRISTHNPPYR